MIFPRVHLSKNSANTRTIVPQQNKQVFHDESLVAKFVDEFDVGEALLVGANLVHALDDEDSFRFQHTLGFMRGPEIQIQHSLMVFFP